MQFVRIGDAFTYTYTGGPMMRSSDGDGGWKVPWPAWPAWPVWLAGGLV